MITATEPPAEQAGPILRCSLHSGPPGTPRPIVRVFRRFFRCLECSLPCNVRSGRLVRDLAVASGPEGCNDIAAVGVCPE